MREPFDIARRVKRPRAEAGEIVQCIIAVARPFAAEHRPHVPLRRWLPQHLALAEERGSRVEIPPGHVVLRETLASGVPEGNPGRELVHDERSGCRAAHVAGVEIAIRTDQIARPLLQRRPRARDVDDAAQGVPSEERALRPADEFNLIDVQELDARRVGVQLRHAVDVAGDARVRRARTDAPDPRVAQLSRRELVEEDVRCKPSRLTDGPKSSAC